MGLPRKIRRVSILVSLIAPGIIVAHALLYNVSVTDTLFITEKPSPRLAFKDTLQLDESSNMRQSARDGMGISEQDSMNSVAADAVLLSESAAATSNTFYQVSATTAVSIIDASSPGISTVEAIQLSEGNSQGSVVADLLSIADSITRGFLREVIDSLTVADIVTAKRDETVSNGEEEERGRNRGPDRTVLDDSHFERNPLDKMQTRSVYFLDSQGNAIQQFREGKSVDISATIRNYQGTLQSYVMIVMIVDENNYAVEIIISPGQIKDGDSADVTESWTPKADGVYTLKIMIWDEISPSPTALSEVVVRSVTVPS